MKELAGRVAVVTGGASGIGRGMALAFAEADMQVVIADIDEESARSVAREIEAMGGRCLPLRVDLVKAQEVEGLAEKVWSDLGGAHLLCNNAGVTTFGMMCEGIPDLDWDWVLAVNLHGVVNGLRAFLPRMRELPGEKHVVNTSSTTGVGPGVFVGPYAATKHAVLGLSETLREEGAAHGISCSALCPNNVDTGIVAADRNRQAEFGGPTGAGNEMVAAFIASGLAPERVGRMVRQAVIDDLPFIFTHADTRELVDARYQRMVESFAWADRWHEANPEP
ncbi:MAG: short-chain dehydrogenase [Deltaproteobacteria bacterium]|jgi:NAD(P)-dependent dehydrogenase (short-subunit alcohol dehydrogenase family)|nr:short-chain dehydrogenase [Deltaproteobacteria bacterium]